MSFVEKIAGVLVRPGQNSSSEDEHPLYMKYGGQVLGIVGSFFAILFGLYNCLGIVFFNVLCLVSGIIQMLVGFLVIAIEAPLCCSCIEYADTASKLINSRPLWNKAALYCIVAIPPVILCPGLGSLFGCGLIFGTGVIYGMMSLGKKASAEEMRNAAVQSGLAGSNNLTTNDRSSIVNNGQPFSFTGAVGTDSNV